MNTLQFTHDTIRMLGIHGLAVYMLMRCAEEEGNVPVSHQWILDHMPGKTSPNTVTAELRRLCSPERQIAIRVTGGWRLNRENAFQLPLTYNLPEGENLSQSENLSQRGFGDPIIIIDSPLINESLINNNNKDKIRAERDSQKQDLGIESNSAVSSIQGKTTISRSGEESAALDAALQSWAIIGKKKDELIACEWVNADYVLAHVEFAKAEQKWNGRHVGMAITRMLAQVDQPARRENGHIENCPCAECKIDSYVGGRYAEYINRTNEEHADDCLCIACQREYPERFCKFMKSDGRGRFWECDEYVESGHTFCSEHEDGA